MEYENYLITYKQIDFDVFIKFTDKISKVSYVNTITKDYLDTINITKFTKMFENCIGSVPNYFIVIELSPDENQLILYLTYDTEMISISQTIQLNKVDNNQTKSNDVLLKKIKQLERIIEENNVVTIAKIFNLETQNYNLITVSNDFIRYHPDTEHITVILPENTHDISRNRRMNYEIRFNNDIDPTEIFTNLKKITTNNPWYLLYFCSYCIYAFPENENGREDLRKNLKIGIAYNNTIEEIEFTKNTNWLYLNYFYQFTNKHDFVETPITNQKYFMNNSIEINCHGVNKSINFNKINTQNKFNFPKLKKITYDYIETDEPITFILNFIKHCEALKILKLTKINFSIPVMKNNPERIRQCSSSLSEIRTYCEQNNIEIMIGEIVY